MKPEKLVSVIIPFYNRLNFLSLVMAGFNRQSDSNFELIIAEDNEAPNNSRAIQGFRSQFPHLTIRHVSQPDIGFRKNKILNEATRVAQGELLIFIDGDCVPHRHFVRQHRLLAQPRTALSGRRVNLGSQTTEKVLQECALDQLSFHRLSFSDSRRVEEGLYFRWLPSYFNRPRSLMGCNWSIHKADLLSINGHDEEYQRASVGEDSDIDWRLRRAGVRLASVKFRAVVYHLYHTANYSWDDIDFNMNLLQEKQHQGKFVCVKGIDDKTDLKT